MKKVFLFLITICLLSIFLINNSVDGVHAENSIDEEVIELRDEYSKVFLRNGGIYEQIIYSYPVHELVNNQWVEINYNQLIDPINQNGPQGLDDPIIWDGGGSLRNLYDAYIDSNNPSTNYGTSSLMYVTSDGQKSSIIRSNINGIGDDFIIVGASYNFKGYFVRDVQHITVNTYVIDYNWTETTVNYNLLFYQCNEQIETKTIYPTPNSGLGNPFSFSLDITDEAIKAVEGGQNHFGIKIEGVEGSNLMIYTYESVNYRPSISVYYQYISNDYLSEILYDEFGFSATQSSLIEECIDAVSNLNNESTMRKNWRESRVISELKYNDGAWDVVAGNVYSSNLKQDYFINTLGFTTEEYDSISGFVGLSGSNPDSNDFAHLMYTLAANLAYYDYMNDVPAVVIYSDQFFTYLAGWLGDATLNSNGPISMPTSDYRADLDASNIYHLLSKYQMPLKRGLIYYYHFLPDYGRVDLFLNDIDLVTIYLYVATEIGATTMEDVYYFSPVTYSFLMSLSDGLDYMGEYIYDNE